MQIKHNEELDRFFERCWNNIQSNSYNQFLGKKITSKNESYIKKKLIKLGCPEFVQNPNLSLFISSEEWKKSPYHSHIQLNQIKDEHFSYRKDKILGNELFNYSCIQKDPNRELNDYLMLRALDKDVDTIYLLQDDQDWMLDAPSESMTNDPIASLAHDKVLTFGLGIGYFHYMCMLNPKVKSITVIEKSQEVINMFKNYIYPQFPHDISLEIICGDAYDYYNKEYLEQFDFIYSDIWQSNDDGLYHINKMLEQYHNPDKDIHFWIEDSCEEIIWTLIFIYFDEIYFNRLDYVPKELDDYMGRVVLCLKKKEKVITSSDDIKYYMYDRNVIREILSTTIGH